MKDNEILKFNFNQPKTLSTLPLQTVNQQHSPSSYQTFQSTGGIGQYESVNVEDIYLNPAPRSQLGVPTNKVYKGETKDYYEEILGNGNFVRGNEFGLDYKGRKMFSKPHFKEVVDIESVKPKKGNIDYLGSEKKIVMRNQSPFYPFPSFTLLKNKDYKSYPHEQQYVNKQPIYNYPYGLQEGIPKGKYNPFLIEGFTNQEYNYWEKVFLGIIITFLILILYGLCIIFSNRKK